ncbi:unnamed protein product [Closterium sp. Naga37s-1]|nr:unnamed protein product [Closterium sp. Naga37s-1]
MGVEVDFEAPQEQLQGVPGGEHGGSEAAVGVMGVGFLDYSDEEDGEEEAAWVLLDVHAEHEEDTVVFRRARGGHGGVPVWVEGAGRGASGGQLKQQAHHKPSPRPSNPLPTFSPLPPLFSIPEAEHEQDTVVFRRARAGHGGVPVWVEGAGRGASGAQLKQQAHHKPSPRPSNPLPTFSPLPPLFSIPEAEHDTVVFRRARAGHGGVPVWVEGAGRGASGAQLKQQAHHKPSPRPSNPLPTFSPLPPLFSIPEAEHEQDTVVFRRARAGHGGVPVWVEGAGRGASGAQLKQQAHHKPSPRPSNPLPTFSPLPPLFSIPEAEQDTVVFRARAGHGGVPVWVEGAGRGASGAQLKQQAHHKPSPRPSNPLPTFSPLPPLFSIPEAEHEQDTVVFRFGSRELAEGRHEQDTVVFRFGSREQAETRMAQLGQQTRINALSSLLSPPSFPPFSILKQSTRRTRWCSEHEEDTVVFRFGSREQAEAQLEQLEEQAQSLREQIQDADYPNGVVLEEEEVFPIPVPVPVMQSELEALQSAAQGEGAAEQAAQEQGAQEYAAQGGYGELGAAEPGAAKDGGIVSGEEAAEAPVHEEESRRYALYFHPSDFLAIQASERKEDVVLHQLQLRAARASERKEDVVLHQLQLKVGASERKEDVVLHQLQLKVGVYSVPHPARASRGGDDAYLVEGNWLGVADGIGTWTDQGEEWCAVVWGGEGRQGVVRGINAGLYSREMMWNCVNVIRSRQEGADSDEDDDSDDELADEFDLTDRGALAEGHWQRGTAGAFSHLSDRHNTKCHSRFLPPLPMRPLVPPPGINAGLYSREMMWNCVNVIRSRQEGADSDEDDDSDDEFADHLEGGRSDSELDSDHNDSAGVGRGPAAGGSLDGAGGGTGGMGGGAGGGRGRGVGDAGGGVVSGVGAGGDDYDYGYYDDEEDLDPMDPKGVIEESHSRTDLRGSCTITLAVLDKDVSGNVGCYSLKTSGKHRQLWIRAAEEGRASDPLSLPLPPAPLPTSVSLTSSPPAQRLRVASIGSCGFVLLRRGELVIRSERMEHSFGNPHRQLRLRRGELVIRSERMEHSFGNPFQIGHEAGDGPDCAKVSSCLCHPPFPLRSERMEHSFGNPFQIGHEAGDGPDCAKIGHEAGDGPDCAKDYTIPVQAGDAILLATNGLFDNLFLDTIVRVLCAALGEGKRPESVARKLVSMAHKAGESTTEPTPYAIAAKAAGVNHEGGRRDDVTVIVAYVQ